MNTALDGKQNHASCRVALFGTSANPPTGPKGHAGVLFWAVQQQVWPVDEVWVVPVFQHVFSEKKDMVAFEHRLQMAKIAFADLANGRVKVCDVEREIAQHHGLDCVPMIEVLRTLRRRHPDTEFALILGADTKRDLEEGKWVEGEALLRETKILTVPRPGVRLQSELATPFELGDASSSEARTTRDKTRLKELVAPAVLAYIEREHLYGFKG